VTRFDRWVGSWRWPGASSAPASTRPTPKLHDGEADAIVYDAPVLEHRVQVTGSGNEIVVGGIFAHEDHGIAMSTGSALRKKVNTALLDMRSDGAYDQIYSRYFGTGTGS
jgi:polar amino acid transport system substrate-binding protein